MIVKHNYFILVGYIMLSCQINNLEEPIDCPLSNIALAFEIQNTDCGQTTGSIQLSVSGGVAPYSYQLADGPVITEPFFNNLSAGEYNITVTDALGCSAMNAALVANANGLLVSSSSTASGCLDESGSLTITASEGVEPYRYQIDNNPPQDEANFAVAPGLYLITVTDAINCEFVFTAQVSSTTSYQLDVQPIMVSNCNIFGCHDGSNSSLPNFNNFTLVSDNAAMIKSRTQSGNMPRNGSLTQQEKDIIACWVDDGAVDN